MELRQRHIHLKYRRKRLWYKGRLHPHQRGCDPHCHTPPICRNKPIEVWGMHILHLRQILRRLAHRPQWRWIQPRRLCNRQELHSRQLRLFRSRTLKSRQGVADIQLHRQPPVRTHHSLHRQPIHLWHWRDCSRRKRKRRRRLVHAPGHTSRPTALGSRTVYPQRTKNIHTQIDDFQRSGPRPYLYSQWAWPAKD